jgi:hypothetical protein
MQEEVRQAVYGQTIKRNSGGYSPTVESGYLENDAIYGRYIEGFQQAGFDLSFPSDLANKALTKARLKVKDQNFNAAMALAEHAQTGRYVAQQLRRMSEIIRAFKKRNFSALRRYFRGDVASKMLRDLQNEWLQLQYALRPLMGDIHGVVEALDKVPYNERIVTVKASSKRKYQFRNTIDKPGNNAPTAHFRIDGEAGHGSYVRIDVSPDNAALLTAAALGFTNPVHLGWELTKLSFVVDWAYPLGDYFSQFDALCGWEVRGYSTSNFTKVKCEVRRLSFTQTNGLSWTQDASGKWYFVRLGRTGGTSVPFATLPKVKDPASASHVMSALALLRQAIL